MAIDSRFIGIWWSPLNGRGQYFLDPQTGDGLFYFIPGPQGEPYELPDPNTLLYPSAPPNSRRQWTRVAPQSGNTIEGQWRHESVNGDDAQNTTYRPDGTFESLLDGDSTVYGGTYSLLQDSAGKHVFMNQYRCRTQTRGNTYHSDAFDGRTDDGTFTFGTNPAGKQTFFVSSDPATIWTRE